MITLILICLAATFGWLAGRRFAVGQQEERAEKAQRQPVEGGRRGTLRLRPMRIRR